MSCPYCAKGSTRYDSGSGPVHYIGDITVACHGDLVGPEPAPVPNVSAPVWELVVQDMQARDQFGRAKYGTPLQAHNGRDALVDLYQELLDAVVYTRQLIAERDHAA